MVNGKPQRKAVRLPGVIYKQGHAYSVTVCTRERHPWFALSPALAEECATQLETLAKERGSDIFAWCLMPDHLHLLVQDVDLVAFMRIFKGRLAKQAREYQTGDTLWQRGFYDHTLRGEELLLDVAKYIWANPVRAGLVASPAKYEWSGSLVWPSWREEFRGTEYGRG